MLFRSVFYPIKSKCRVYSTAKHISDIHKMACPCCQGSQNVSVPREFMTFIKIPDNPAQPDYQEYEINGERARTIFQKELESLQKHPDGIFFPVSTIPEPVQWVLQQSRSSDGRDRTDLVFSDESGSEGPFAAQILIKLKNDAPKGYDFGVYDSCEFLLDVRINSTYAFYPPQINFRSIILHPFIGQDEGNAFPLAFYEKVPTVEPSDDVLNCPASSSTNSPARKLQKSASKNVYRLQALLTRILDFMAVSHFNPAFFGQKRPSSNGLAVNDIDNNYFSSDGTAASSQTLPNNFLVTNQAGQMFLQRRNNVQVYKEKWMSNGQLFAVNNKTGVPEEWLDPRFREFQKKIDEFKVETNMSTEIGGGALDKLKAVKLKTILDDFLINPTKNAEKIYSFPLFTPEFCDVLVAEVRQIYHSKIDIRRPNSMNRYGVILNEIGLEEVMNLYGKSN